MRVRWVLVVLLGAGAAAAEPVEVPRATAERLVGCWEIAGRVVHRIGVRRDGRGLAVRHRFDAADGRRRVLETELRRDAASGTLYFEGLSANHHAGRLAIAAADDGLSVRLYY